MEQQTRTENQTVETREERLFSSLGKILQAKARTIAIRKGDTTIFEEINQTKIIPDNELPILESGNYQIHASQFCKKYGISESELTETMNLIGL